MNIHRVCHATIPASAFKPEAKKGSSPKILRWFIDEDFIDYSLRVEDERDGKFVLYAYPPVVVNEVKISGTVVATGESSCEMLAQTTVDKIEVSPNRDLTRDCDFVIFQDSPETMKLCRDKDQ